MIKSIPMALIGALLTQILGCAQVHVVPLDTKGNVLSGAQEGVRYYLPKPYLLVAEVPLDPVSQTIELTTTDGSTGKKSTTKKGPPPSSDDPNAPAKDTGSGDSPSSTGNTSFAMFTKQYGIKLIYLPDYSQPMAIYQSTGVIGASQMKPSLQDGWMLTSLDASGDSKVADTLSAVASIISSIKGGGSSASGTSKNGGATAAANKAMERFDSVASKNPILPPGLYEFVYTDGKLTSLKAVAYFCPDAGISKDPCP